MNNRSGSFKVGECLGIAWDKVYGAKGTFMAGIGLIILAAIALGIIGGVIQTISQPLGVLAVIVMEIFLTLLTMGLIYIAIRRARGLPITYKQMFYTIDLTIAIHILVAYILQSLMAVIPALILGGAAFLLMSIDNTLARMLGVFCGIGAGVAVMYILLRTVLSYGFVIDRRMGGLDAVKSSMACTKGHTLEILLVVIVQTIAYLLGILTLGIGLIWAVPFYVIAYGVLYTQLSDAKYPVPAVKGNV